jgi:hypothetical protein
VASESRHIGLLWRRRDTRSALAGLVLTVLLGLSGGCAPDGPDGVPTHPTDTYAVTLEWNAPTTDAVGRPLEDLDSFRLYYRPLHAPSFEPAVEVGMATSATVQGLSAGEWVFAVTAVDELGNESALSDPLLVELGR